MFLVLGCLKYVNSAASPKTVFDYHRLYYSPLDHQDKTKWKDLENVYFEIEKEFVRLYNQCYYESTLTCKLLLFTVDTNRPGRPSYHIPRGFSRIAWA